MNENIEIKGSLQLMIEEASTGKLIEDFKAENLVVSLGRKNMAELLGGASTGKKITRFAVGEGTDPVDLGNTSLTNPFTKLIDGVVYPAGNKVRFSFSLSDSEANGMNITELALLNDANVIFSRKTRSPIVKTSNVIITGLWTITIN